MKRDDTVYLAHMLMSISKIMRYSEGKNYSDFIQNEMLQDALIHQVQIIGEASSRVATEIKKKYKEIPWIDIKNMRNKLVHDYFGVDIDEVWKVVQKDLPDLRQQIKKVLTDIDPQLSMEY